MEASRSRSRSKSCWTSARRAPETPLSGPWQLPAGPGRPPEPPGCWQGPSAWHRSGGAGTPPAGPGGVGRPWHRLLNLAAGVLPALLPEQPLHLRALPKAAQVLLRKGGDHLHPLGKAAQVLVLLREAGETSRRSMAAWKDRTASTVTAMVSRNARGSTRKAGSRSTRSSTGGAETAPAGWRRRPRPGSW